ncbi:MAG TPA: sensor histidine kinase, partial [Longimicrobium sp.]|nr:sensor histidine kinase [Longimicrobium sp.]
CIDQALEDGGPALAEYPMMVNGGERFYEARVVRCGDDAVLSIVRDVTERRRSEAALAAREETLRALAERFVRAQEEERARVAREIHDDVCQQLAALALRVSALARDDPARQDAFTALRRSIEEVAASVRGISHRLHPSVLELAGLPAALRSHCAEPGAAPGVSVHLAVGPRMDRVPLEPALAAYRIVQEALRNVSRHARAANAWVRVSCRGGELRVVVLDDGRGVDARDPQLEHGLGMVSMRERARMAGGTLRVRPRRGGGTRVEARIPLGRVSGSLDSPSVSEA